MIEATVRDDTSYNVIKAVIQQHDKYDKADNYQKIKQHFVHFHNFDYLYRNPVLRITAFHNDQYGK